MTIKKTLKAVNTGNCTIYGDWATIIVNWHEAGPNCYVYLIGGHYGLGVTNHGQLPYKSVEKIIKKAEAGRRNINAETFCRMELQKLLRLRV